MDTSKKSAPTHDELLQRMEREPIGRGRELGVSSQTLEALLHRRKRRRSTAGFPFSLLERGIRSALALLERMVARVVRAVIR